MFFNANLEELGLESRVSMSSASTYVTQTFRDRTAFKSYTDIYGKIRSDPRPDPIRPADGPDPCPTLV